jgi:hypothetical protein
MSYAKTGRKWQKADMTAKEYHDKRQEDVKRLLDGLEEWKSDRTEAQLAEFLGKWDGYHGNNPLLIEFGSDSLATDVDARGAWWERERMPIGKGTGIKLVAPEVRSVDDPAKPGQKKEIVTGWHIFYVFDIRHTIPREAKDDHPIMDQWNLDHPKGEDDSRHWGDDENAIAAWHAQYDPDFATAGV